MKSKATKEKALAMYINNESLSKISRETKVGLQTLRKWKIKHEWVKLREEAIQKGTDNSLNLHSKIIEEQIDIVTLAQKELLKRLRKKNITITDNNLLVVMKHGLEVIRPKSTNQFNFMNQEADTVVYKFEVENGTKERTNKQGKFQEGGT